MDKEDSSGICIRLEAFAEIPLRAELFCKQSVDPLKGLAHQLLASDVTDLTGGQKSAVMTALFGFFRRKIPLRTVCQLN